MLQAAKASAAVIWIASLALHGFVPASLELFERWDVSGLVDSYPRIVGDTLSVSFQ